MTTDRHIIEYLRTQVLDLLAVYRFGSRVRGGAGVRSDLDLAILPHTPLPPLQRFTIEQDLAALMHMDVDLVDLAAASSVMRMQIVATGECVYSSNEPARLRFETYVYSSYARLNEERREILEQVIRRGRVYA